MKIKIIIIKITLTCDHHSVLILVRALKNISKIYITSYWIEASFNENSVDSKHNKISILIPQKILRPLIMCNLIDKCHLKGTFVSWNVAVGTFYIVQDTFLYRPLFVFHLGQAILANVENSLAPRYKGFTRYLD